FSHRHLAEGGGGIPAAVGSSSASGRGRCRIPDGLLVGNHQTAAAPYRWREMEGSRRDPLRRCTCGGGGEISSSLLVGVDDGRCPVATSLQKIVYWPLARTGEVVGLPASTSFPAALILLYQHPKVILFILQVARTRCLHKTTLSSINTMKNKISSNIGVLFFKFRSKAQDEKIFQIFTSCAVTFSFTIASLLLGEVTL
ncbi:unnamed protein product, partial [Urochloa humidicola]